MDAAVWESRPCSTEWPLVLASLKSRLETGDRLGETRHWPKGM